MPILIWPLRYGIITSEMAEKIIATNKEARHNYALFDAYEAGIELKGGEVKSLRAGKASLKESFARIEKGELLLYNMHIAPYEGTTVDIPDPKRVRKLLLHKKDISKLAAKTSQRGYTIIPTKIYFKKGYAKVEIAIARGKRTWDKRETIQKREAEREVRRSLRGKG